MKPHTVVGSLTLQYSQNSTKKLRKALSSLSKVLPMPLSALPSAPRHQPQLLPFPYWLMVPNTIILTSLICPKHFLVRRAASLDQNGLLWHFSSALCTCLTCRSMRTKFKATGSFFTQIPASQSRLCPALCTSCA